MAKIVVTLKIMPVSPDVSLDALRNGVDAVILKYGKIYKQAIRPIAFGINALEYSVIMDETEAGTTPMEEEIKEEVPDVSDVQVTEVTRMVDFK